MMKEYYYVGYCPNCDIEWARRVEVEEDEKTPTAIHDPCPHCEHHLTFHWVEEENENE